MSLKPDLQARRRRSSDLRRRCVVEGCTEPRVSTGYCVYHQGYSPRASFSEKPRSARASFGDLNQQYAYSPALHGLARAPAGSVGSVGGQLEINLSKLISDPDEDQHGPPSPTSSDDMTARRLDQLRAIPSSPPTPQMDYNPQKQHLGPNGLNGPQKFWAAPFNLSSTNPTRKLSSVWSNKPLTPSMYGLRDSASGYDVSERDSFNLEPRRQSIVRFKSISSTIKAGMEAFLKGRWDEETGTVRGLGQLSDEMTEAVRNGLGNPKFSAKATCYMNHYLHDWERASRAVAVLPTSPPLPFNQPCQADHMRVHALLQDDGDYVVKVHSAYPPPQSPELYRDPFSLTIQIMYSGELRAPGHRDWNRRNIEFQGYQLRSLEGSVADVMKAVGILRYIISLQSSSTSKSRNKRGKNRGGKAGQGRGGKYNKHKQKQLSTIPNHPGHSGGKRGGHPTFSIRPITLGAVEAATGAPPRQFYAHGPPRGPPHGPPPPGHGIIHGNNHVANHWQDGVSPNNNNNHNSNNNNHNNSNNNNNNNITNNNSVY